MKTNGAEHELGLKCSKSRNERVKDCTAVKPSHTPKMGGNYSSGFLWVKGGNKASLVRDANPGHGSFGRWPRTPSPFLWGEDVVTPQEVLLPREVLVEATLGDHPEMVQSARVDVLCREVCGIQGRVAWGLRKPQHSCRRTSAEQLT